MRSKAFNILLFCLIAGQVSAQYTLSGIIQSREDSTAIKECVIYLNDGTQNALSDGHGRFVFNDVANGEHILQFTSTEFEYLQLPVSISDQNKMIRVSLAPRTKVLAEVMITDAQSGFGIRRMRGVENVGRKVGDELLRNDDL